MRLSQDRPESILGAAGELIAPAAPNERWRDLGLDSRTLDRISSAELLELMAELGVGPERTLMVGDTTHDLQLAANAGVASVAVSYGAHPVEDFARHAPLFVAHSTRELHDWLQQHA